MSTKKERENLENRIKNLEIAITSLPILLRSEVDKQTGMAIMKLSKEFFDANKSLGSDFAKQIAMSGLGADIFITGDKTEG